MGYKAEQMKGKAMVLIGGFFDVAEALRDECQEVVDNAPDGLRSSPRIEALEEAINTLGEMVDGDREPRVKEELKKELEGLEATCVVTMKTGKRRGQESRAVRMSNGVWMGTAGMEALRAWVEEESLDVTGNPDDLSEGALRLAEDMRKERRNELEVVNDWLEEVDGYLSSAEGVEFPGWGG